MAVKASNNRKAFQMEWILYRYRVYRLLRNDYSGVEAWRYSAGYRLHMLDGLTPMLAVEWEKTFGVVGRPRFSTSLGVNAKLFVGRFAPTQGNFDEEKS